MKEEQILNLLRSRGDPMTAREITDVLYGPEKHQSIVFGKLQEMVRLYQLEKVGIQPPYRYTIRADQQKGKAEKPAKMMQKPPVQPSVVHGKTSDCDIEELLHSFFTTMQENQIEIYNEFSLQHELGIYLRENLTGYKVQFERNVSFFFQNVKTIKKEIDIVVYDDERGERYAIELKHPLNGQYPEQMYAFVKDIKFNEELLKLSFTKTFAVVLVKDRPFYTGNNNSGIYRYFREEKRVYGTIKKPTGTIHASDSITLDGDYSINWSEAGSGRYYIIAAE